ncbi:glycosyltransferase family 2 protein [Magnetospirillum gryphiswaldense]|uniref:Glycosyltransferases involved in cell wall biogenesis n=1 Tax=Magnetospirillum gryphiswaldense TaxID=55518 RepID=A4U2U0_9PROT|nr:glycosyltransferase family A protein [Magnetospirillum gryphiswaldense]AVM75611.1 UDP-Glc:alpha-D-GlcNAc-diphosphoundecaprenol beta-1,3-glucosyltransferase WfgD [Magnetospirillum gryphiswaldense MSR-1]AVM79514.1 UDP-Glc:alpha-D-GlcNAc-diphosphoundecaprenol beta-1,3-glucosyltransferase WfgD [Magnetospirillum gryphiswaldense]CAM77197.1 Glycosyltransferases involved in cell wall biogenesis [Magnetospirillum gryphiswaldense MSR-1]
MTRPVVPVSVIMPAYNNAATVRRALSSVAAQSVAPMQVVVVDDGSADESAQRAQSCAALLAPTELVVISQANAGAGAARNAAIALAKGEFLAFLDADDEWLPEKLEHSLAHLAGADILFVSHDMDVQSKVGAVVPMDCAVHFNRARDPFSALMRRGFVATSTVVARRDAVLAAGGFAIHLRAAQDYDLWLRLAQNGRFVVFPGAWTRYHLNDSGITANVEQRRLCSLMVLHRNMVGLYGRSGAWATVILRTAIIHYEAASAHIGRRQLGPALAALLRFPYCLAGTLLLFLRGKSTPGGAECR